MKAERKIDHCGRPDWNWPVIERVGIVDSGQAVGIVLRERDGTVSVVRVGIDQIAD
jgi:hypothetical protein